ncbi:MAG: DUF6541 family protein, partial [Arenicella sp.]
MVESFLFLLLLLTTLVLPGAALLSVFNSQRCQKLCFFTAQSQLTLSKIPYPFLLSVSLSYGIFAMVLTMARVLQLSYQQLSTVVLLYCSVAGLVYLYHVLRLSLEALHNLNARNITLAWLPPFTIVVFMSIYHAWVGAYTEIPADIYYHIEKFSRVQEVFLRGELSPVPSFLTALKQDVEVWYHLLALVGLHAGASTSQVVQMATLLSQCVFLLGVYYFSTRIFNTRSHVAVIAMLATFLVAFHMGVTAFSYLRYYALAPAMLAFILYFSAVIIFWDLLLKRRFDFLLVKVLFLIFALTSAVLIHTQEAMFIMIQCSLMLCFFAVNLWRDNRFNQSELRQFDQLILLLAALVVFLFASAYLYLHYEFVHFGNNGNRLWDFGPAYGVLPQLSILNPSYQFMQVVTLWGVVVYVLFFLHWSRYKKNLFLVSGMLLPLLTVFNPFFTDLFLRLVDSTVLWRFCFLIPIHYVAADLMLFYLQRLISGETKVWRHRVISMIVLSLFALLLMPFFNGWRGLHYSRYPTLIAVQERQSYQHLNDVVEFLNQVPEKHVLLTDPVTGYVLSGFTKHHSFRDKFFINEYSGFKRFTFDDYSDNPLEKYSDHILVINQRTIHNGDSFVGAVTRHWPTDLFQRI